MAMVRRPLTSRVFVVYPLERGGWAVFNEATGYQVVSFAGETLANRAAANLNECSFYNDRPSR